MSTIIKPSRKPAILKKFNCLVRPGVEETMAIFLAKSALIKLDFPTLGAPIMARFKPSLIFFNSICRVSNISFWFSLVDGKVKI
jgi:hypothetical protein